MNDIEEIAKEVVSKRLTITGVQPKLSLNIDRPKKRVSNTEPSSYPRLTIVGLWGKYILKPPHPEHPNLPELEDISMHLAGACGIKTALHGLMRLKSGELSYIASRFDRENDEKLAMEDMCQLTERLTEDKYHSSMETVGKVIQKFSDNSGNDLISFLQITLFSFLIGNADMHLKNFSLLTNKDNEIGLSPAYDLVATKLIFPDDLEETALTVNGKKRKLKQGDFFAMCNTLGIPEKAIENQFKNLKSKLPNLFTLIEKSFLPLETRERFSQLLTLNSQILFS